MTEILPAARPEMARAFAVSLLAEHDILPDVPAIVVRRGYYRDSMGVAGENDRGIYDDAIALVSPNLFAAFNANADPSREKPGVGVIQPGCYQYELGIHNRTKAKERQYEALIQASGLTILRDGETEPRRDVWGGFNIHRGGYGTTGSEGCITIPPSQWGAFIELVRSEMKHHGLERIAVVVSARGDV